MLPHHWFASFSSFNNAAFVWTSAGGIQLLNSLVTGGVTVAGYGTPESWGMVTAAKTNNEGQIAGSFNFDASDGTDSTHGYILTPAGGTSGAAAISSLSYSPATVAAGADSTGSITFTVATPAAGAVVTISTDGTQTGTVSFSTSTTSGTYSQQTGFMTAGTHTMTGAYGGKSATASLTVTANSSLPKLSSISFSPSTVAPGASSTCTVKLSAAAPTGGAMVWIVQNGTPLGTVSIAAGSTETAFSFTAPSTAGTYTEAAVYNGGKASTTLTVGSAPAVALSGVSLNPTSVTGGANSTGTVTLTAAAPSGGTTVSLSCDSPDVAEVPSSVTVSAGATSATFTVQTDTVTSSVVANIEATLGTAKETATLTVNPAASSSLKSVTLSPTSTVGGSAATTANRVYWSSDAPASEKMTLKSSNTSVATVPSSVTISSGSSSHTFTITTKSVTASTNVTITATSGGVTQTATLTVTPASTTVVPKSIVCNPSPAYSSGYSTLTVTLSGAAPSGGTSVSITLNNSAFTTQTVAAGQSSLVVGVNWGYASANTTETFVATANSTPISTTVTLEPTSVTLSSFKFSPSSVVGGNSTTATVTLSAAAPSGGAVVQLTYNGSAWYTLDIAAGQTSGSFTVTTSSVTSSASYKYVANYNGASKSATLTITP